MMCGYIKSKAAITMVWTIHHCIHGLQLPKIRIRPQKSHWEDWGGLNIHWQKGQKKKATKTKRQKKRDISWTHEKKKREYFWNKSERIWTNAQLTRMNISGTGVVKYLDTTYNQLTKLHVYINYHFIPILLLSIFHYHKIIFDHSVMSLF